MIDTFSLALSHGLILLVFWRLLWRPDLDDDAAPSAPPRKTMKRADPPEPPRA